MRRVATVSTVCETLRISAYRSHPISNNKKAPAPDGTNAFFGAADRDRTGTSFTSRDFKSRASASSATAANEFALQINIIPLFM